MASGCIFCGNTPVTREHLFPDWLRSVNAQMPVPAKTTNRLSNPGGVIREWDPGLVSPQLQIRDYCKNCNEGWMSEIENAAKKVMTPMILGTPKSLSTGEQSTIALWAALKTIVGRGLQEESHAMLPEWIEHMYLTRSVPSTWRIWLSAYSGKHRYYFNAADLEEDELLIQPEPSEVVGSRAGLASFIIGKLGLKVLASRWPDAHGELRHAFLPIFPALGQRMRWPPDAVVTDDSFDQFISVFKRGIKPPL